jgi:hypothetical protein
MYHGTAGHTRRLLDLIERLLWDAQDTARMADGWQVVRLGRWHRAYRHPGLLASTLAAQVRTANETRAAAPGHPAAGADLRQRVDPVQAVRNPRPAWQERV